MGRLTSRVNRLEQSRGQVGCCLLYTDAWSEEQLEAEITRLKQTYSSVLPMLVDGDDLVGSFPMTMSHEDALRELDDFEAARRP